jgi:tetratricopeptide (TPR) repeat protein
VHSRALSILADLELEAGNAAEAETLRRDAVRLAIADGHDDAAVHLMLDQADAALVDERIASAELHLAYFDAFAPRMTDPEARADVERRAEIVRGRLDLARGDHDAAERRLAALPSEDLGDLDRRALWMALGDAQRKLGRGDDAFATWSKLLTLVEQLRGDAHADVAAVLNNLALVRLDDGDHAAAQVLLVRAEAIALASLGDDDPLIATIATNRGWASRVAGQPDDARHQLERALRIGRATYGDRHAALAPALDQLGEREAGNLEASIERFGEAGEIRDAALGVDHPETATTLLGMARTFLAMGKHETAKGALEAAKRIMGTHPVAPRKRVELAMWMVVAATAR